MRHEAVGTFLTRIGLIIEISECWWCGAAEQTVEHLYGRCRKWRRQRGNLVRELAKGNIQRQPQVERRWLASLLGDEKAVTPLLKFLKAIGIGRGEGQGRESWNGSEKNDREGEDVLG